MTSPANAAEARGRGTGHRARVQAEAGAEGQARQRGAAEPRGEGSSAHTERRAAERRPSIADGTAKMHLGEEGAATLRDSGISLGLFVYMPRIRYSSSRTLSSYM